MVIIHRLNSSGQAIGQRFPGGLSGSLKDHICVHRRSFADLNPSLALTGGFCLKQVIANSQHTWQSILGCQEGDLRLPLPALG
jgi:hypothetical protein